MGLANCQWAVEYSNRTCHNVCYMDDDNWQLLLRFLTLISRWLWWWNMSTCAGQITNLLEFASTFREGIAFKTKIFGFLKYVFPSFFLQKLCISKAVGEVWWWESGLLQQREGNSSSVSELCLQQFVSFARSHCHQYSIMTGKGGVEVGGWTRTLHHGQWVNTPHLH